MHSRIIDFVKLVVQKTQTLLFHFRKSNLIFFYHLQNPGQLKVYSGGVLWKKQGGGKAVEVDKSDLLSLTWMKVPRSNQLGVRTKDGLYYKFTGFRDQVNTYLLFDFVTLFFFSL